MGSARLGGVVRRGYVPPRRRERFAPSALGHRWLASLPRHSPERRDRWAWRFFALGFIFSTLAEATWTFYELVLAQESPSPSIADFFFMAFYPAMFAGILFLVRRPPGRFTRITVMLDSLLFTLGLAGLAWQLVLAPSVTGEDSLLLVAVTVAYPMWDLVLVFALTTLFLSWRLERVALAPLFLLTSFAVTVLADLIYAWLTLQSEFSTGSIVDPLWPLSYALGGLAAISLIRGAAPASETRAAIGAGTGAASTAGLVDLHRSKVLRLLLPYLVFPAVVAILFVDFREHAGTLDTRDFLVLGFAVLLLVLVIVRQFLTLLENTRLNTSLGMLSQNLELRVVELTEKGDALSARTAQLDTLNRGATALSRSLKPAEVLATGLDLACEAAATTGGVAWVRDRGARVVLAAHRGLGETTRDILVVLQSEPSMGVVFKAQAPTMVMTADVPVLAGLTDHLWPWEALAVVPLVSRGRPLGVLGLLIDDASVNYRTDLLLLEESIGAQLGVALENAQQYEDALILAERDSVTGLLNHRGIHERLDQEVNRAQRVGGKVSLVMMDLDSFKLFNDTYGHPVGDDVLREVGSHLSAALRSSDIVGRYGGDEFAAILPDTGGQGAVELAHRLRDFIYDHPFESPDGLPIPLHLSYGVATYPTDARSSTELVGFADANMYLSKQQGGNMVTSARTDDLSEIRGEFAGAGVFGVLDGLVTAVDKKDRYTRHHSEDVTGRALMLGRHLALSDESQSILRIAGLLHDVGKIGVPDAILQKPGRLDVGEFDIVKHHVQLGELIIKEVPNLSEVIEAVGAHHEHFDGTGYPRGLRGEAIPRLGRILAVADAYSAMTTDRPYRKAMSHEEAVAELLRVSGTQLDPTLVQAFLTALEGDDALATSSSAIGAG
jgi:diguanylate cyclase (GGDEF)-like protein